MSKNTSPVLIYALGGLEEVGKNTYVVEDKDNIILLDAGVKFPGDSHPGVDYVIPEYTHLKEHRHKIKALFITHGHEDHIGGIPFLVRTVHVPIIYAPRLAAALIKAKLDMMRLKEPVNIEIYDENTRINVGNFEVSFFRVTHSIPDSFGICVDTPEGRIVNTGDFKVDLTPVGPDMQLNKIAKLGSEGVDLLLSDSTNAEIEGFTPSEKTVLASIEDIFAKAQTRIIVSTFSSNIARIQQVIETAVKHNRRIAIIGRSMENTVEISRRFGYIKMPDAFLINSENIKDYRPNEICVLCTGSQGEPMAALSRIATNDLKQLAIQPGDVVVFSSSPIPGNGPSIERIVNLLAKNGADVITNNILFNLHSSGHPAKQELRLVLKLFQPKHFMPVHGEYRMLKLHAKIAHELGISDDKTFICSNGDILELKNHKVTRGGKLPASAIYIDGNDLQGIDYHLLDERLVMKEDGVIAYVVTLDKNSNKLICPPTLTAKGFICEDVDDFMNDIRKTVDEKLHVLLSSTIQTSELKIQLRSLLTHLIHEKSGRNPVIVPILLQV